MRRDVDERRGEGMTKSEIIDVLKQSWRELRFESSPTANELSTAILQLADEWGIVVEYAKNATAVEP